MTQPTAPHSNSTKQKLERHSIQPSDSLVPSLKQLVRCQVPARLPVLRTTAADASQFGPWANGLHARFRQWKACMCITLAGTHMGHTHRAFRARRAGASAISHLLGWALAQQLRHTRQWHTCVLQSPAPALPRRAIKYVKHDIVVRVRVEMQCGHKCTSKAGCAKPTGTQFVQTTANRQLIAGGQKRATV